MTEKAFRQLNIDPEFKNLIRPLRREEYRQLELNLVMEGCREDIIAWNDTILDGHNRYEICNKNAHSLWSQGAGFSKQRCCHRLDLCEPTWAPQHLRRNQEISDWETI